MSTSPRDAIHIFFETLQAMHGAVALAHLETLGGDDVQHLGWLFKLFAERLDEVYCVLADAQPALPRADDA